MADLILVVFLGFLGKHYAYTLCHELARLAFVMLGAQHPSQRTAVSAHRTSFIVWLGKLGVSNGGISPVQARFGEDRRDRNMCIVSNESTKAQNQWDIRVYDPNIIFTVRRVSRYIHSGRGIVLYHDRSPRRPVVFPPLGKAQPTAPASFPPSAPLPHSLRARVPC